MNRDHRARDLIARAHKLPAGEQEDFLAEACGDDIELRQEVKRLLTDSKRADPSLSDDGGAGATLSADAFDASYAQAEGDEIGPYTLRQQIGEGGFGVVWMAEQREPISRMVALKVVKAGMDTKQVLSRFEAERQAVAMMDHPNIAKVLDAGATPTGRPYFAMELVKGMPITEFCEGQKLGTRRRLELFRDVCSAVNHAHQKGIIHRDLKPSNIMVTLEADRPLAKVIDFGIAKATHNKLTEKTLFTRFEQFLGTPAYMSPEQAAMSNLDVDTRSDIYSLGVLLYELLAGAPPFDQKSLLSAGYDEMRRIIAEDEPPKPSTRVTQTQAGIAAGPKPKKFHVSASVLRGDLDWIVMKAIEKDRSRRYETANAFAADVGRYLDDEPVLAAAPSAAYKFRKFARRHKAAFGVAALTTILLVGGILVSTWQAVRASRAERAAEQNLVTAEVARADAEAVSEFIVDMFTKTRPGEEKGGRELKVADVLDRAVAELEANRAVPTARRAELQGTLGLTYRALGLYPRAIELQERERDYHLATSGPEHPDTLKAMINLAVSYRAAGRRDEAIGLQEELLTLARKINGPEHPDTLSAMNNLAASYHDAGRWDEALGLQEKALTLARKVNDPEHPDMLWAMNNLALSYHDAGRLGEALELREEVLSLARKILDSEPPLTLAAMSNLAISYSAAGRGDEALEMREEMLALHRKVLGPEHPDTLKAMINLAISYHDAGRLDEALEMNEKVLALARKVNRSEHPDTFAAMDNLAISYARAGRGGEALEMFEEVLALRRKVLGPEHPETFGAIENLALSYVDAGRREEALDMREELLALRRKVLGPEHPDTLRAMKNLAVSYRDAGRLDEARDLRVEIAAAGEGATEPGVDVAPTPPPATEDVERLEEILRSTLLVHDDDHEYTLAAKAKLAAALRASGDDAKAAILEKEVAESNARAEARRADR